MSQMSVPLKKNMSEEPKQAPLEEQSICIKCGFCCDATLFTTASLNPGERGHLPEKLEGNSFSKGNKEYFRQPCPYFSGNCTIYDRKRADICSSYRCQLLKDFAEGKITMSEALEIISVATRMREELMEQYRAISGNNSRIPLSALLIELGKIQKSVSEGASVSSEYEMLQAQCNILEVLLIKHIRSAEDFTKMVMK